MPRTRGRPTTRTTAIAALAALLLAVTGCSGQPNPGSATPGGGGLESAQAPRGEDTGTDEADRVLDEYAVAAAHPEAVAAGMQILDQGGNAADAAIAVAFAVAVVEPYASGIGGGGTALVAQGNQDPTSYDYRETVALDGVIPESGTGIPGFVDGMATLHERHGSLDWPELLAPAIALAEQGFPISPMLAQRMRTDFGPRALDGQDHFKGFAGLSPLDEGDVLVQQELAQTMQVLAAEGPEAFYTGSLVEDLTAVEGLDARSLAAYDTEVATPVSGQFGDYQVVSAAPALPGAALIQFLQIAEALDVAHTAPGSAQYVDRMTRAWQIADQSVLEHFGDPDYVEVPVDRLTDAESNARLAGTAPASGPASTPAAAAPLTPGNTTHLTVVDADGLTVSMTNTITNFWGGATAGSVGGFFLNNQLSRFESLNTPDNQPAPGRKSVSWSAPSLVLDRGGRVVMGLGTPGGHQIPSILANVMVPWALQDAPLQEAVDSPRHHLQDGVLTLETEPPADLAQLIAERGWQTRLTQREDAIFGSVQALEIDYENRTITGAKDTRREGDVQIRTD